MAFKKLTPQQRNTLNALQALGVMVVTPNDARPLKALQKRGMVAYRRGPDGERVAVMRKNRRERVAARQHRIKADGLWELLRQAENDHITRANKAALDALAEDAQRGLAILKARAA